jgi:serine protease AprX
VTSTLRARWFSALLILAVSCGVAPAAFAGQRPKVDRALDRALDTNSGGRHRVIVRAHKGFASWVRQEIERRGGQVEAEHPSIDGIAAEVEAGLVTHLAALGVVSGVSTDADIFATAKPGSTGKARKRAPLNTLLSNIGLSPNPLAGQGVTVALIDSGLHPSTAFAGRIKAFYDFTGGRQLARTAFDDYGHGTHVAGLIGGAQLANDSDLQGVAPGVSFVALKVLSGDGSGKTSDVIRAIEFAVANADRFGIEIINRTARGGRPGTTALQSPTSLRPATSLPRKHRHRARCSRSTRSCTTRAGRARPS